MHGEIKIPDIIGDPDTDEHQKESHSDMYKKIYEVTKNVSVKDRAKIVNPEDRKKNIEEH